jgi:hypothetical protein
MTGDWNGRSDPLWERRDEFALRIQRAELFGEGVKTENKR